MKLRLSQVGKISPGNQGSFSPTWIDFDVIMSEIVYSIGMHGIHLQIKLHNTITHIHGLVIASIIKRGET